nr:hypothetical protein [Tanacetum cinerariifolium]
MIDQLQTWKGDVGLDAFENKDVVVFPIEYHDDNTQLNMTACLAKLWEYNKHKMYVYEILERAHMVGSEASIDLAMGLRRLIFSPWFFGGGVINEAALFLILVLDDEDAMKNGATGCSGSTVLLMRVDSRSLAVASSLLMRMNLVCDAASCSLCNVLIATSFGRFFAMKAMDSLIDGGIVRRNESTIDRRWI